MKGIPPQVIFRSIPVLEILRGSRSSQSCDVDFDHVTAQAALHAFHENMYSTRVVTSVEEMGNMS